MTNMQRKCKREKEKKEVNLNLSLKLLTSIQNVRYANNPSKNDWK